jgi:RNA polymerase sigma-70 factor (ECF subfamily)
MTPLAQRADGSPEDEPRNLAEGAPAEAVSFDRLYEDYLDFVWRAACRLGIEAADADDVAQEVFFIAHRRLHEFEGRASAKTWLFRILYHVVQHHFRSHARKHKHLLLASAPLDPDHLPAAGGAGPAESAEQAEALRVLDQLLAQLEDGRRAVFVLAEIEQMTAAEIALALGINVNTVYSRLRVARQEFESALARHRKGEARRNP